MLDFSRFTTNQKETLLFMLMEVLNADRNKDSREWVYIQEMANQMNLDPKKIDIENFKWDIPKEEQDRMAMFYYLLFLTKVDKKINQQEEGKIQKFCLKLGFSEMMADDFILLVRKHLGERIPTEKMLNIIKKYLN